jgi:hypothetical protein
MPAVHAAYCDGVAVQCVSRNMDPPYWFGLPDTCLLPNLRSVNLPGIPARLVFSGMNFMCIFPGKSSSSAASPNDGRDNVNVIEPLRNPPLTNVDTHNIFAFLEANEHAWQYGPQSDNTPLAYYCARRLAVATRVGHPKIWWFSVAFGNYAYATGSWELAQNSLMGLKRYLGIEKGRWRPLAADASQTPNRVDGYAVSARCQWWVVAVKLILLELDKQLLRGDLEGVKGVLRQFFTLVVENVMFIKEYHIVWAMQEVYSALIMFPLDNFVDEVDDEVEGLVRWMEDMWGGRMSMLSTHPWGLAGTSIVQTPRRDDRVAAYRVLCGRGTDQDVVTLYQLLLNPGISRLNKLGCRLALAFHNRGTDPSFLATLMALAEEAKQRQYNRLLVLIFALIQHNFKATLRAAWDAGSSTLDDGSFLGKMSALVFGIIEWFFTRMDKDLSNAIKDSDIWKNMVRCRLHESPRFVFAS